MSSEKDSKTREPSPKAAYQQYHEAIYQGLAERKMGGWSTLDETLDMARQMAEALKAVGAATTGRLLELGCGDGAFTAAMLESWEYSVSAIDISSTAIDLAQKRLQSLGLAAEFATGSVLELPWGDEAFDVAVDSHCFHCIVLDDRARFLAEASRVLRPGGLLVIMTMAGDPPPALREHFDMETRCLVFDGVIARQIAHEEAILRELTQAGFEIAYHRLYQAKNKDEECDDLVVLAQQGKRGTS